MKSSQRAVSSLPRSRTRKGAAAAGRTFSTVSGAFMPDALSEPWLRAPRSCGPEHDVVHAIPVEVLQQQTQTLLGALQMHVVTEAGLCVHAIDAGLFGIDFPRM